MSATLKELRAHLVAAKTALSAGNLAAAREVGVEPTVLELPGLQLDVDVESDLDELSGGALGEATADVLRSLGRVIPPPPQLTASEGAP